MKIILSHRYLDFDALASMVAVQKLYPDARLVIEGKYGSFVQAFLALAKEHFPYDRIKDIDIEQVTKVFLVDTHDLNRAVSNKELVARLQAIELEVIDHHPYEGPKKKNYSIENVGACTTLLVEQIMDKGIKLTSFEATLLALGIYDDTGSLLFENTTSRDLLAASFLVEKGAQLGVVAEYLHRPLSDEQMDLFQQLLDNGMTETFEGTPVYFSYAECEDYFGGLAVLAQRIGEIESADSLFIVVRMENRVYIVARSRGNDLPVNKIVQVFGGAGHDKAASAVTKETDVHTVIAKLRIEIQNRIEKPSLIRDIMSFPVKTVHPDTTMEDAGSILLKYGHTGVPVVDNDQLIGVISRRDVDKALKHGLQHAPVKGFMTQDVVTVCPDLTWEEAQKLMVLHDIGRIPVVENGQLVGIVSRSDVLRLIYGSAVPTTIGLARERSLARREGILSLLNRLPSEMKDVLQAIQEAALELNSAVYLVGGFVRDLLLLVPTTDLDLVVEGDSMVFAEALSRKLHTTKLVLHPTFRTARLTMEDGTHLDIAGSRREDYDFPGALPKVEESTLRDDLFRRDFTINAMALCLNQSCFGEIIDYYGGFRDLQQGEIRFLHNLSFIEDPTRILRAIRFVGRYGFKFAKITKDAIPTALDTQVLTKISAERFTEELMLIFQEPNYQNMGRKLVEFSVLPAWFQADYPWNFNEEDAAASWPVEKRWLVSLKKITQADVLKILEGLRLNKQLHKLTLDYMNIREAFSETIVDLGKMDELLANVPDVIREALMMHEEFAQPLKQYIIALAGIKMQTTGADLKQLGIKEGPQIGQALKLLRTQWLKGTIKTDREEKEYVKKHLGKG